MKGWVIALVVLIAPSTVARQPVSEIPFDAADVGLPADLAQAKKTPAPVLATVTLIIDGMT